MISRKEEVDLAVDAVIDVLAVLDKVVANDDATEIISEIFQTLDEIIELVNEEKEECQSYGVITLYNADRGYKEFEIQLTDGLIQDVEFCMTCSSIYVDESSMLATRLDFLLTHGVIIDVLVESECTHYECIERLIELTLVREVSDLIQGLLEG